MASIFRFGQYKAYVFNKENSCETCDKDDQLTVINAPLVGIVYKMKKDLALYLR